MKPLGKWISSAMLGVGDTEAWIRPSCSQLSSAGAPADSQPLGQPTDEQGSPFCLTRPPRTLPQFILQAGVSTHSTTIFTHIQVRAADLAIQNLIAWL